MNQSGGLEMEESYEDPNFDENGKALWGVPGAGAYETAGGLLLLFTSFRSQLICQTPSVVRVTHLTPLRVTARPTSLVWAYGQQHRWMPAGVFHVTNPVTPGSECANPTRR
jgi:hypothetical protein